MEVQVNPAGVIVYDPDLEALFAAAGIPAAALAPYRGHAYRVLNYCVVQLAPQCTADPVLRRTWRPAPMVRLRPAVGPPEEFKDYINEESAS